MNKLDVRLRWAPTEELSVGTLALVERRGLFFEFSPEFVAAGLPLSPWKLPAVPGLIEHRDRSFGPIFGVFDDSLPDGWGLLLMDRKLRRAGMDPARVSVLDRLALLGSRTMGALTYHPPAEGAVPQDELDLDALAHQAEEVLAGTADEVLPELERAGGSPGGARPKVVIGLKGSRVTSGDGDLPEGFEHWLVKFTARADPARNGPVEHAYMRMAEAAGLTVPPTRLFTRARHFGVQRFDRRPGNRRLHMHTFGNMIHSDFRVPSVDYDTLLRVTGALTRDHRAVEQAFRRMLFNVAAHNRDDHVKNFAFLMDERGEWTLSPAYDLGFSHGPGGEHTMTVAGEGRTPGREHCLRLAATHGISPARADALIDEVRSAVVRWPEWAAASHVAKQRMNEIAREQAHASQQLSRGR